MSATPTCCRGTSGFVQLALDLQTGTHLAIKFISRGRQHVDVNMKEITRELLVRRLLLIHSPKIT